LPPPEAEKLLRDVTDPGHRKAVCCGNFQIVKVSRLLKDSFMIGCKQTRDRPLVSDSKEINDLPPNRNEGTLLLWRSWRREAHRPNRASRRQSFPDFADLERDLQPELDLPPRCGNGEDAPRIADNCAGSGEHVELRGIKIRPVQDVEELGAKFHVALFSS